LIDESRRIQILREGNQAAGQIEITLFSVLSSRFSVSFFKQNKLKFELKTLADSSTEQRK